jgi:hypothetical protein
MTTHDIILIVCALAVFGGILFNAIFIAVLVYHGARAKPVRPGIHEDPTTDPSLAVRSRFLTTAASDPLN